MFEQEDPLHNRLKYPSVSDVFSPYCKARYTGMSLEEIIKIEEKHSYVISHCMAIVNKIWQIEENSEYKNYVSSFQKWHTKNVKEIYATELILHDDVNRFTGKIDMLCRVHGSEDLQSVTIKTSMPSKSWKLQLAAYKCLCNSNLFNSNKNIILQLSKKGDIADEFESDSMNQDWRVFQSILTGWHYFKGDGHEKYI